MTGCSIITHTQHFVPQTRLFQVGHGDICESVRTTRRVCASQRPTSPHQPISIQPDYHRRREAINFTLSFSPPPPPPPAPPAQFLSLHPHLPPSRFAEPAPQDLLSCILKSGRRPRLRGGSPNNGGGGGGTSPWVGGDGGSGQRRASACVP